MDNLKNIFALGTANFIKCADNFVDTQKDEDDNIYKYCRRLNRGARTRLL